MNSSNTNNAGISAQLEFQTVSVTIYGDYYQVVFHDDLDTDDEPYFMLQTQYEFPDGGICHFESHREKLIDQCKAEKATLSKNDLRISYGSEPRRDVNIVFARCDSSFLKLASTLKVMLPEITVKVKGA